jgi:hypothetical protein
MFLIPSSINSGLQDKHFPSLSIYFSLNFYPLRLVNVSMSCC